MAGNIKKALNENVLELADEKSALPENEIPSIPDPQEKEKKLAPKKEIVLPFDSDNFKAAWDGWKEYKAKEHNFKYKSLISELATLHELQHLSRNNESIATRIIFQSISSGWKGFFKLKDENGKPKPTDARQQGLDDLKRKSIAILQGLAGKDD